MIDSYSIFDALGVAVFVHDAVTGDILYVNSSCSEEFDGLSSEELMNGGLSLISTDDSEYNIIRAKELLQKAAKGEPQVFEWKSKGALGNEIWLEVSLNGLKVNDKDLVVATIKNITQKRDIRKKLELNERYQKTINSIIEVIFPLKLENDVLWNLAESCGKELGFDDLIIYMYDNENELIQSAAYGDKVIENRQIDNPIVLSLDTGIVGSVAQNKKSEIVNDLAKDNRYIQDVTVRNSEIAVPILVGDKLLGVIDSENSKSNFFSQFHLEILETVASFAAIKIEQARLYEREHESQASMNAILNSNPDLVFILSDEGRYLDIYTKNQHMLAAPKEQLLGSLIDDYLDEFELNRIKNMLNELVENGIENSIEYKRMSIDGIERWFSTKVSRVEYKGKGASLLMSRDITKTKLIQRQVEESEKLMASINRNISEGIYRSIPNNKFVYVNEAFINLFGFNTKEELLDVEPSSLYAIPEERKKVFNELAIKGYFRNIPFKFRRKDGSTFWGAMSSMLTKDSEGNDVFDGAIRDITEQREAQIKIEESENILSSINKNISEGLYRSYSEGGLIYVNNAFANMFGYKNVEEILSVESLDLYANPVDRKGETPEILETGYRSDIETLFKRKNGSTFWGLNSFVLTTDHEGKNVFDGAIRDITEQREARIKIKESENILSSINKNISEGLYRSYSEGGLIYANNAFANMFGYKNVEDILSVKSLDLYANPVDRKGETPEILKTGYRSDVETLFKRKDGSTFWGLNSFVLTTDHEGKNVFDGAIRDISNEKAAAEELNKLNSKLLERNKILALKEKELESSNEELRSNRDSLVQTLSKLSERNFELDQLVYKTSHDLRAPLRSVLGLTNIMKIESGQLDTDYIDKIDERILKMDDFIKSMLDYSKASRMGVENEELNIETLIHDCLSDLEYLDGYNNILVQTTFKGGVKTVVTDVLRNRIIFANIISNAFKYRDAQKEDSYLKIAVSITSDSYFIVFEDNGIGISQEYLNQVFDMFFRATEKSDGSGLGMYIVKQSIDKLQGTIDIESELGKGTKFTISLPL